MLERNVHPPWLREARTTSSPARRATAILVSRRKLPGIRVDSFAAFLDRAHHLASVFGSYGPGERQQILGGNSLRFMTGQRPDDLQHELLLRRRQLVQAFNDFLGYRRVHSEFSSAQPK